MGERDSGERNEVTDILNFLKLELSTSSPILGSVYFDLTFFNKISQLHETINIIHAQIIAAASRSQPKENQSRQQEQGVSVHIPVTRAPHSWH
jgi:hypothetical protein